MKKYNQIEQLKKILHSSFNDFYNKEVKDVANKLVNIITGGNSLLNDKYQAALIDAYKFLSEVEYLDKNYESCLNYIIKLQLSVAYKSETENTIIHATIRRFQCEVYLGIYQKNDDKTRKLLKELTEFGNHNRYKLEKNLKDDYDKILDLTKSFLNNSIKTIVNFKLPYKIEISNNEEIVYDYNGVRINLKFETISNKGQVPFQTHHGILELDKDKYGVCSTSDLTLTFDTFFDATHNADKLLDLCSETFNYFLDYYRSSTEYFWIDNLNLKQIQASNIRVTSENYDDIISIPLFYKQNIIITSNPRFIDKEKLDKLKDNITKKQQPPLWKILYLDSKNNIFIEKYRESVISINSAFENYLNIKSNEILSSKMTEEEIKNYMQGNVSYATYSLKEFISEEYFNIAAEKGLITSYSPSTFQIIKKCFEFDDNSRITASKREINKLVYSIRKNRNDIIHGNDKLIKSIESDVRMSIVSFETFINVFK